MAFGLDQSHKGIVVIVLAFLVLAVGVVFTVLQISNLRDLRESVEEEKLALAGARIDFNEGISHRENEPEYRERIRVLNIMMPETAQEEQILRYFFYLAEEHDLSIQLITFEERISYIDQGFVSMPLSFTLEGRFSNMVNLFAHLYQGSRAVRVESIDITLAPEANLPANIRANISANAFHVLME